MTRNWSAKNPLLIIFLMSSVAAWLPSPLALCKDGFSTEQIQAANHPLLASGIEGWQNQACDSSSALGPERVLLDLQDFEPDQARSLCSAFRERQKQIPQAAPLELQCVNWKPTTLSLQLGVSSPCRYQAVLLLNKKGKASIHWNERDGLPGFSVELPDATENLGVIPTTEWMDHTLRVASSLRVESLMEVKERLLRAEGMSSDWSAGTRKKPELRNWLSLIAEISATLGAGAGYYYTHINWASSDWDLAYSDLPGKITFAPGTNSFDTNSLGINGLSHPLAGMLYYLAARENRLGPVESTALAIVSSYLWETFVEIREKTSFNDMIFTPVAGSLLGESMHALIHYLDCRQKNLSPTECARREGETEISLQAATGFRMESGATGPGTLTSLRFETENEKSPMKKAAGFSFLHPGDWSRFSAWVGFQSGAANPAGFRVEAESLIAGIQGAFKKGADSSSSVTYQISLDSGYVYQDGQLDTQANRFANVDLLGARARVQIPAGDLLVELQVRAAGGLLIVESWALGPWAHAPGAPHGASRTLDSSLRIRGFAYEWSGSTTLEAAMMDINQLWRISASLTTLQGWKVEGGDRYPDRATQPARGLTDNRMMATASAEVKIPGQPIRTGLLFEFERGESTLEDQTVAAESARVLGTVSLQFR